MGDIRVRVWPERAPKTVANFLSYVDASFYDGTIFHRVIPRFMIQGGGMDQQMREKPTRPPIVNEAGAAVPNRRGAIAMARGPEVNSATAQFFINHVDNAGLDHRNSSADGFGYAAFGEVIDGMDVVDRIAKVATTRVAPHDDVPAKPVVIQSIRRVP
jgi:cyclophilin family peptidyl-prolyl cis-trans isomerase